MKQITYVIITIICFFIVLFGFRYIKNNAEILLIDQSSVSEPFKNSNNKVIKWGAYAGDSIADKEEFEEKIGAKPDYISTFLLWGEGNYFPIELASNVKNNDQTLVIYWESRDAKTRNLNDKKYSYDAIIDGEWDDYIRSIGQTIKESGAQVILIPFIEMNGNWYPWSITKNNNNPEKHKLAYQKIHTLIGGIPNIKFAWVVNNGGAPDVPENEVEGLYPGSEYIDYVGVDGFNFGTPWQNFDEVFTDSLIELKKFNKPIVIFSMASSDGEKKAEWIENFGVQLLKYPEVKGFIWFNQDKERDWRIWSDSASLDAFTRLLKYIN